MAWRNAKFAPSTSRIRSAHHIQVSKYTREILGSNCGMVDDNTRFIYIERSNTMSRFERMKKIKSVYFCRFAFAFVQAITLARNGGALASQLCLFSPWRGGIHHYSIMSASRFQGFKVSRFRS